MNDLTLILRYLYPNNQLMLLGMGWVAAAMISSMISNNQSFQNKMLNVLKHGFLVSLLISWVQVAGLHAGRPFSWTSLILGVHGFLLVTIGDFLAFAIHRTRLFPGGPRSWFWTQIHKAASWVSAFSARLAIHSLDPTEIQIARHVRSNTPVEEAG